MKKILTFLAVAAVITGCNTDDPQDGMTPSADDSSAPQMVDHTFTTGSMSRVDFDIENTSVVYSWESGDVVTGWFNDSSNTMSSYTLESIDPDTKAATFTGTKPEDATKLSLLHPYKAEHSGSSVTVDLTAQSIDVSSDAKAYYMDNTHYMYSNSASTLAANPALEMKHVAAICEIKIDAGFATTCGAVTGVEIKGFDYNSATITNGDDPSVAYSSTSDVSAAVSVENATAGELSLYLAVAPQSTEVSEYEVYVTFAGVDDGTVTIKRVVTPTVAFTLDAGDKFGASLSYSNINSTTENFTVDGTAGIAAFVALGTNNIEVNDLTLMGTSITSMSAFNDLTGLISKVNGAFTLKDNSIKGNDTVSTLLPSLYYGGDIIIKDSSTFNNMNVFTGMLANNDYKIIGDLIFENIPLLDFGWTNNEITKITEIGGDLIIKECLLFTANVANAGFISLWKVGGDFNIQKGTTTETSRILYNFTNIPITYIGGSLIVKDNPSLSSLKGLENLTCIGGSEVTISTLISLGKNEITSGNPNLTLIKYFKDDGIITDPDCVITIDNNGTAVDVDDLTYVDYSDWTY